MRTSNNIITFKWPVLLTILNNLAELSVVGFNDFLFVLYKPNSLINYLIL
jgi:hypothetical protein